MALSPDHKLLFSAGADGSLFVSKVSEEKIPSKKDQEELDKKQKVFITVVQEDEEERAEFHVMDPSLAGIVLVQAQEMDEWLERKEILQKDLDATERRVNAKLLECKERYSKHFRKLTEQKELDIQDLKARYAQLNHQKGIQ